VEDFLPEQDPYKGWNRASIMYLSRKPYRPNIRTEDLLLPSGRGNLRMFGMSAAMALMMTLLYVWTPLFFLNVWVPLSGAIYGGVLGGAIVTLTSCIYFFGARETRRDRELAARL
jgi:hypothetical protein